MYHMIARSSVSKQAHMQAHERFYLCMPAGDNAKYAFPPVKIGRSALPLTEKENNNNLVAKRAPPWAKKTAIASKTSSNTVQHDGKTMARTPSHVLCKATQCLSVHVCLYNVYNTQKHAKQRYTSHMSPIPCWMSLTSSNIHVGQNESLRLIRQPSLFLEASNDTRLQRMCSAKVV